MIFTCVGKSPLTYPQVNIPVSPPIKGRVVCRQHEVTKSLGLLAAAHSVCVFPQALSSQEKEEGSQPLLLVTSAYTLALDLLKTRSVSFKLSD